MLLASWRAELPQRATASTVKRSWWLCAMFAARRKPQLLTRCAHAVELKYSATPTRQGKLTGRHRLRSETGGSGRSCPATFDARVHPRSRPGELACAGSADGPCHCIEQSMHGRNMPGCCVAAATAPCRVLHPNTATGWQLIFGVHESASSVSKFMQASVDQ